MNFLHYFPGYHRRAFFRLAALCLLFPLHADAQTLNFTNSTDRDWDVSGNWTPAVIPDAAGANVIINRTAGGGGREISGDGDTYRLGILTWTNDDDSNEEWRDGTWIFDNLGADAIFTYAGSDGANLQLRNGTVIQVDTGNTLIINNASSDDGSRILFADNGDGGELDGGGTVIFRDTSGGGGDPRVLRFEQRSDNFTGLLRIESGVLEFHEDGDVFGDGTFEIAGGAIESDDDGFDLTNNVIISNDFSFIGGDEFEISGNTTLAAGQHTLNNIANDLILSGLISGPGGLRKIGSEDVFITNAGNTFSGPIEVNEGELEFTGNSLGNTTSLTADGGRIAFRGNYTIAPGKTIFVGNGPETSLSTPGGGSFVTFNGVIANKPGEVGSWAKQGGGTLELGGANTFTGDVAVNNGELRLSNLNALSTASGVRVDDATLQLNVTGENQWQIGTGPIVLDNDATLRQFDGSDTDIAIIGQEIQIGPGGGRLNAPGDSRLYAEGNITGSGELRKTGGGELRFRGSNKTYTGVTNVTNGRLRIDDDGVPVATPEINLDGGNLRFGQRQIRTFSLGAGGNAPINLIDGSIEYTDEFGAILTNPIDVSGPGNLRSRIAGSVFEFTGPLTGNGNLEINRGTGGNPVQGGTIFLSGDASGFTGNVSVLQSTLRIGENTVLGAANFDLAADGVLGIDIQSQNTFGVVDAASATLASGSTIAPRFTGGLPSGESEFTIITGTVTDNGAQVSNTALVQFGLRQGSLILTANVDYRGVGLGLNQNQSAVGSFLNGITPGGAVGQIQGFALNAPDAAAVASFYDAVAAEELGGLMDTTLHNGRDQLRHLARRASRSQDRLILRDPIAAPSSSYDGSPTDGKGGKSLSAKSPLTDSDWTVYNDVLVHRGSRAREFELGGYDSTGQGFVFGADRAITDDFTFGFFGSYEHGRTAFDRSRGFADSDSVGIGALGTWSLPQGTLTAGMQYHHHSFEMERYSPLGTARSSFDGDQLGFILQGTTELGNGPLSIAPVAHLQYHHLWTDGFNESGSAIAQQFGSHSADSLEFGLGVRVGYEIIGNNATWRPYGYAEYRHELLDADRTITSTFPGAGSLTVVSPERDSGHFATGAGFEVALSNTTSAYLQYEGQFYGGDTNAHGIYTGFRHYLGEDNFSESVLNFVGSPASYRETLRGSALGDAMDAINLRALAHIQYDGAQTAARGGTAADPDDPADTDAWFARRIRLSADRQLRGGFAADVAYQFGEDVTGGDSGIELHSTNIAWEPFEPFTLRAGYDRVPLGWEDTTSSARIKTIERSAASRIFSRLGGDDIGGFHWRTSAGGRFRELYTNPTGPINRYDFHYEFSVANPREAVDALYRDDPAGLTDRWPDPSYYLRLHNELRTSVGNFDFGADLAWISTFRARGDDAVTGAEAISPFLNYNYGWFNFLAQGMSAEYDRDAANGGAARNPSGLTLIPSLYLTPQLELVGMYSRFDSDGDFAVRHNSGSRNMPTTYPENRRFDEIEQFYLGLNHYLDGDDLKVMYGVEHTRADGTRADRAVGEEDGWAFRVRFQLRL